MTGERERLPRLLSLVPYLQAHPGVAIATAAADFGVSEEQLRRDLQLLWMCGLPGHGPGDLIDLSFEGDSVSVIFDAGISRPLRLTAEEALALVEAGIAFEVVPGVSSLAAVPGAAGIPVTHRGVSSQVTIVNGHGPLDYAALAAAPGTLVAFMGLGRLSELSAGLINHGRRASTPAAVIASGTLPAQRVVVAPLGGIAAAAAELDPPVRQPGEVAEKIRVGL